MDDLNIINDQYEFTSSQDWFSLRTPTWQSLFHLILSQSPRALEIGSWEGRSAVFLLTTFCATHGELVCIDHFDLMETTEGRERYRKFTHNLRLTGRPARVLPQFTIPALYILLEEEIHKGKDAGFDWIYIGRSHHSDDTILEAELAWRLARPGCIFIFDDYNWLEQPLDSQRRGIKAFLVIHQGEYEHLSTNPEQHQIILQKTTPMRIGFLLEPVRHKDVFEYGMNIALTVNSACAMTATVTLRSALENLQGQVTFYVVDCGLLAEDKNKIEESLLTHSDVTLLFVPLPPNSLSSDMGPVWAKVDMMKCLPVQRILYLDADTLVRKDLKELWNTDLGDNSLAAAPDIGRPMDPLGIPRMEYFNTGVLLIDLTRVRSRSQDLEKCCRKMAHSKYHDQDALNVHFKTDWVALSLTWNSQGLGTYAECTEANEEKLPLEEMKNPAIVHFTGPLHPSIETVSSTHPRPYTPKPWGYAGAPGHPYGGEWWDMLKKTVWKETAEYKEACESTRMGDIGSVRNEFDKNLQLIEGN